MASKLSDALLGHIIGFVEDPRDHARMQRVCRNWHSGASKETTWGARYVRDYGAKGAGDRRSYAKLYRQVFQRSHCSQTPFETELTAAHTDGERVYTICEGNITVWNLESGKKERIFQVAGAGCNIHVDTQRVYVWDQTNGGGYDSLLLAFDKNSGKTSYEIVNSMRFHSIDIPTCFSDKYIFRCRNITHLCKYNKEDGQLIATITTPIKTRSMITCLEMYKNILIANTESDGFTVCDAMTGKSLKQLFVPKKEGWDEHMRQIAFQCDEQFIYTLVSNGCERGMNRTRLIVWNRQDDYRLVTDLLLSHVKDTYRFQLTQNEVVFASDFLVILEKGTWKTKKTAHIPMACRTLNVTDVAGIRGARIVTASYGKGFVVHDFATKTT